MSSSPVEVSQPKPVVPSAKETVSGDESNDSGLDDQDPDRRSITPSSSDDESPKPMPSIEDEETIETKVDENDDDDETNDDNEEDDNSTDGVEKELDEEKLNEAIDDYRSVSDNDEDKNVIDNDDDDDTKDVLNVTPENEVILNDFTASEKKRFDNLKIMYNGRDILDFCANIANKSWNVQYTHLPENNFPMYLANRSQYHRLGASWNTKEYTLDTCRKCLFQYPVKYPDYQTSNTNAIDAPAINASPSATNQMGNANLNNMPIFNGNGNLNQLSMNQNLNINMKTSFNSINSGGHNGANNQFGGHQSLYPNQYNNNNNMAQQQTNNMTTFKQNNQAFFNGNNTAPINSTNFNMNNFNSNMTNNAKQQLFAMYRQQQNFNNSTANGHNNKMPYKMYSHF